MTRKTNMLLPIFLIALVLALAGACGQDEPQEKNNGKVGGSDGSQKNTRTASARGSGGPTYIGRKPKVVYGTSFVGPLTEIFGNVYIGQKDFIASNSVIRAAPGNKVELGDESNVQDNVTMRAYQDSVVVGDRTSLTHHVVVEDSDVGDFVFVGYNAEIDDSEVGDGAFIYHGARIDGVKIPEKSFVGPGEVVSDQRTADALPKTGEVDLAKYYDRKEQIDTNREFAKAYIDLYEKEGYDAVVEVGPNPKTSWNSRRVEPEIGENVELQAFSRVTGDVKIGDSSSVGRRTALRADEGDPISVGPGAAIDDRVSLHATRGSAVEIGKFLVASDDGVLHGPLKMGERDFVGENAVVFRARVGDDVQIGEGAIVAGPAGEGSLLEIPDGTLVPADAVVTSEKDLKALTD
ncbi:MAG: carbonate dehydratase [Rubrobacteraceae bacterium]|nr:carbonate dehydratase [Rubrobacteraceae bacterium]